MQFDFPITPVEGQVYIPYVNGPEYTWRELAWRKSSAGKGGDSSYITRAALVSAIAQGMPVVEGQIYSAGGYLYYGQPNLRVIADLPGLRPLGDVHVEHFGAVADMEYEMATFATTETNQPVGAFLGPYRTKGTNNLAAFMAADDYVTNLITGTDAQSKRSRRGEFFMDGSVPGVARSGYFILGQLILGNTMRSRQDFRNFLWLDNPNVYHSNIWINSVNGGVKGISLIAQYSYSGVAKPFGHGGMGCAITVSTLGTPQGGPAIAVDQTLYPADAKSAADGTRVPFITGIEVDVLLCRAGQGNRVGGGSQRSSSSYLFFGLGGIEHCHWKLGIHEQSNSSSNGLGICHWNMIADMSAGGNPLTNYSAMIPVETYHFCNSKVEFTTDVNMFDQPMGFMSAWEFASNGHIDMGPLTVAGCAPYAVTPGDLINHYANPAQKQKVHKGIRCGPVTAIDVPLSGDIGPAYASGSGSNLYIRGFGTSKFDVDVYETTVNRNICRQLEVDVEFESMVFVRTGTRGYVPRWNGRGFYAQGVQGKLKATVSTYGIGRGYEIEYCDGDQQLNYVDGDGCLLYEFSRGGRLLQTDTNRIVPGYIDNINDGSYRPGDGPGTRALSISGGSYSTIVDNSANPANRINTTTKTYIIPFGGADDDVYRGTPLTFTNPDGTVIQTVTATEFIQGRSASSSGAIEATSVAITGINISPDANTEAIITAPNHGYAPGMWITVTGVQGMTQINGREGRLVFLNTDHFSIDGLSTFGYSAYTGGGTATQKLPTAPIINITQANQAVVTCSRQHGYYEGQFVGIYNVTGLSLPTPGTPFTVTKISRGNPALVTVNTADYKQFFVGQQVTITGADAAHLAANGLHVVGTLNATNKTFALVGVNTLAAGGDQTTGSMAAAPHKSGINGKTGKIKYIDEFTFSIAIDTLVTPALTPYIEPAAVTPPTLPTPNGGAIEAFEGVGYLEHTPLRVPAVNGQKVTVDEFARTKQLSVTSTGGETALRMVSASADQCDMHGLRSARKYGAFLSNARISLRGPLPLTVGVDDSPPDNYTIYADGKSLFSMSDGTIGINPNVAFHLKTVKDSASGSVGHFDLRNCRISDITKLLEGNKSLQRFALSMVGCTDVQTNIFLSHPARQGIDGDNVVGGKGFFHYGDDGILTCWLRNTLTVLDPVDGGFTYDWKFPAAFNAGGDTVAVAVTQVSNTLSAVRKTFVATTGSSTGCKIKFYRVNTIGGISKANPGIITVPNGHRLSNGGIVAITDVAGMSQMNGKSGPVTVIDGTQFHIGVDTSAFSTYAYGGIISDATAFDIIATGRYYDEVPDA